MQGVDLAKVVSGALAESLGIFAARQKWTTFALQN
jgi:hypothetical protein